MLLARLSARPSGHLRYLSTRAAVAEYPEILDLSFEAKRQRKKDVLAKRIQTLPTVEEKVMALNMKKYFGYKCIMLNDEKLPYNSLPMIQYSTRTKFNETGEELPEFYTQFNATAGECLPGIKQRIEDAIFFELECHKQAFDLTSADLTEKEKRNILSSAVVNQIHRIVMSSLASRCEHLSQVDTDSDPVHEAFWFVGGIEPLTIVQNIRDGVEWQKKHKMDPVDRPFQYVGECYSITFPSESLYLTLIYSRKSPPRFATLETSSARRTCPPRQTRGYSPIHPGPTNIGLLHQLQTRCSSSG